MADEAAGRAASTRASAVGARRAAIEAVVFDLGGVLVDWNPRYLYRGLFDGDDAAMERFLAEVCSPEWNAELDAGRSWDEAIDALCRAYPQQRDLIVAFRDRWTEMLGGAYEPTVEVLADLRAAGVPLYALTNWSAETFDLARPHYPFLAWFAGIVVSGAELVRKPDPRIFRILLDRYGLRAESTAFVDDIAENAEAAATLGLVAVQFRDARTLRRDLVALGLPIDR